MLLVVAIGAAVDCAGCTLAGVPDMLGVLSLAVGLTLEIAGVIVSVWLDIAGVVVEVDAAFCPDPFASSFAVAMFSVLATASTAGVIVGFLLLEPLSSSMTSVGMPLTRLELVALITCCSDVISVFVLVLLNIGVSDCVAVGLSFVEVGNL